MKRIFLYILLALCSTLSLPAQTDTPQQKAQALTCDPTFAHAYVGIKVMNGSGDTLAEVNGDKMLVPASNMKLISTGTALYELGRDYRFPTTIAYDGSIEGGILHGNLYIIGGADPTLGSKDTIATPLAVTFGQWEEFVRSAGIKHIDGHIIGDGRWLEGMSEEPSWLMSDLGTYYGTGVTGLMFYENMMSFSVAPGKNVGDPISIKPHYPSCSWMTFRYEGTTGEKGTGDKLYMYTGEFAPVAAIRGTFGVDRGHKQVDCSNEFPEYTCAVYFKNHLENKGIKCPAGAADFRLKKEWKAGDSLKVIGTTFSPALTKIVAVTNKASNNLYAETLLRTLGKVKCGSSCYDSSYVALNEVLKEMHLSASSGFSVKDGSGLSRQNLVSPDFMCRFLGAMMDSDCFEDFLWSLPYPGSDGSLSYNMKGYSEALRRRIRVKSGSMSGVRCYSGYILPEGFNHIPGMPIPQEVKDKTIIFSILTNNCTSPNWKVRPLLDKFMAEMAK